MTNDGVLALFRRNQMGVDALIDAMHTWAGLAELVIGAVCILLAYWLSRWLAKRHFQQHPDRFHRFLPYVGLRLALPVGAQILLFISAIVWVGLLHHKPHLLLAFSALLFWMALIRLLMALLREALPRSRFERHTENTLSAILWLAFATWAIQLDSYVIDWLESVSLKIGKTELDLSTIISAVIWISVIVVVALWISRAMEKRVMRLTELDLNLRIVIAKLARTVLLLAAVLIALQVVGIDLTVLAFLGSAVGIGLGLGLQKIASSYISGFIILLDSSIRIGDRLMVGDRVGSVTKITSRYVVLRSGDGTEALIPNDTMITNTVINQSYSDKKIWNSVSVDVAYDTDLELALRLMVSAAQHSRVEADPGPTAYVANFGASGITLQVGFWVLDPENGFLGLKSDINLAIWRSFALNGIKMPFPQCEVTLLNYNPGGEKA